VGFVLRFKNTIINTKIMINFSFDKIVEFLRVKNWFIIKQNDKYLYFSPAFEFDGGDNNPDDFIIFLPKNRLILKDDIFNIWHVLSKFYKIPFYELALIHFAEMPTVLTLGEYIFAVDYCVKQYADFLNQPLNLFQFVELFEGFEEADGNFYAPYIEIGFYSDYYCFLCNEKTMELPLPKTVEHFVTDFLRIVGEQKRLKFKQK
jgi:hypothetical protein